MSGTRNPPRSTNRSWRQSRNRTEGRRGRSRRRPSDSHPPARLIPQRESRRLRVADRRTAVDYAHALKDLADKHLPKAKKIILVQDNLNTHKPASLYEAFPPAEARRLVERFEWHYSPKHGSWLNMAESELGVLSNQCLDRRIPDQKSLSNEIAAWQKDRNRHHTKANWQFTTEDARIKLKHLYPTF